VQSLAALHREKYRYGTFLKKFMRLGEKMKVSDADFDPIFYTYGLQLYSNLPLIEPLESQEMNNIRELVIAIDTSGSCQGEIVQSFLQKTWNIFRQKENFFTHFRIHIIQCDMVIRDVAEITSMAQFDRYIETLEIQGLGGTDFRPVFSYIQNQADQGVFRRLGGLLYFTDGDGVYPKRQPPWLTAFLFPHNNKDITVPPWAIRYSLEGDE
jgi:predicted metal-dependent peptidase